MARLEAHIFGWSETDQNSSSMNNDFKSELSPLYSLS